MPPEMPKSPVRHTTSYSNLSNRLDSPPVSPTKKFQSPLKISHHPTDDDDDEKMALQHIITTTNTILQNLETLIRRSKDNAADLVLLKQNVASAMDRDHIVIQEVKELLPSLSSPGSTSVKSDSMHQLSSKLDELLTSRTAYSGGTSVPVKDYTETLSHIQQAITLSTHSITAISTQLKAQHHSQISYSEQLSQERTELDELLQQKLELSTDLSRLETTIRIRNDQLSTLEDRTSSLERRVLETTGYILDSNSKSKNRPASPQKPTNSSPRRHFSASQAQNRNSSDSSSSTKTKTWGKKMGSMFGKGDKENNSVPENEEMQFARGLAGYPGLSPESAYVKQLRSFSDGRAGT
ncbi:hypothetical protein NEOLI_004841 [Neolecta irregularis DAH-3]|uniref:Uncharacterized protein n=1 Tax=Neolecta irregularis (strain DAH-3) TaxID=1198029 RepID=A0A1U7LJN2_NEOID|nr:hypothetical protein NEOLI_004841 [Neolecta irregularis DAH-3]|eukprot:OLL22865.1 hypothetical protein NEOLI_004841 [Neolecta irregularis DAH-3]